MTKKSLTLIALLGFGSTLLAQNAETIMKQNGCLSCHAVASKKSAPAFAGIAMRNKRFEGARAKEAIMEAIKKGSKGKYRMFAGSQMPAFPNLTQKELATLADYILAQSSKARCRHGGRGHGMGHGMGRGMM